MDPKHRPHTADSNRPLLVPGIAASRFWARPRPAFLQALALVLAMACGVLLDRLLFLGYVPSDAAAQFRLMAQAWNVIHRHYVDRSALNPTNLAYGAIGGMVDALGDTGHSTFLTPDMSKQVEASAAGHLEGIGIEIQMRSNRVVIVAPLDNSPAQRAGLRPGDVILSVDGRDVAGMPPGRVVQRIAGPVGTSVSLTVLEARSSETRQVTLTRADIKLNPLAWERVPGTAVAHLRIASFAQPLTRHLKEALVEITRANLTGLILDLRSNPGGILSQAVETASQFLREGNVLLVKDAEGNVKPVPVEKPGLATRIPMVVLVNGGSASAAEIVAGALQDAGRATLVGERTFGTGTVLNEYGLFDGSSLLLAVNEWLTPKGHSIWHKGIEPDITVPLSPDVMPLRPEAERDMSAGQLRASQDQQLLRALEVLNTVISP